MCTSYPDHLSSQHLSLNLDGKKGKHAYVCRGKMSEGKERERNLENKNKGKKKKLVRTWSK
jgi:hypothetical protein